MNIEEYQDIAYTFAEYPDALYPVLGLAEEVGELTRVYSKAVRGDSRYVTEEEGFTDYALERLRDEISDVLWMLCAIASENNMSMNDIAKLNIEKLTNRKVRGVIKGDTNDATGQRS